MDSAFGADPAVWLRVSALSSSNALMGEVWAEYCSILGAGAGLVLGYDPSKAEFYPIAARGIKADSGERLTLPATDLTSVVSLDSEWVRDARFLPLHRMTGTGWGALLAAPLVSCGEFRGILVALYSRSTALSRTILALAEFTGHQLGQRTACEQMRKRTAELEDEIEARKLIERAKGILMRRHSLSEEDAYLRLRSESRRSRQPMKELARTIIQSEPAREP